MSYFDSDFEFENDGSENETSWETISRIDKDIKQAAQSMDQGTARNLVDGYYQVQEFRKGLANQIRSAKSKEPNLFHKKTLDITRTFENLIKKGLGEFASRYKVGRWMQSIHGIGPVISAGMLAHIDIRRAPTVAQIYKFAGQTSGIVWGKGEKRPWNAELKTLCWKTSECFVKVKSSEKDYYGKFYDIRREYEEIRNDNGENKEVARSILEEKNYKKTTETYKCLIKGFLSPGHIHARAKRYCVKIFLSHLHHVMFENYHGKPPAMPYAFEKLLWEAHRHYKSPHNWPNDFGGSDLTELYDIE